MLKNKKKQAVLRLFLSLVLIFALVFSMMACGGNFPSVNSNGGNNIGNQTPNQTPDETPDEIPDQTPTDIPKPDVSDTEIPDVTIPDVEDEELIGGADKESAESVILLKGNTAQISGMGATFSTDKEYDIYNADGVKTGQKTTYGTVVEISSSGTYVLEGTLNKGFIAITKKDLVVTLVLNGVNIYCENYAAITCLKKSDVTIELAAGSTNYLTDGGAGATDGKYALAFDS